MAPSSPVGVHLVGSICGAQTAADSFRKCVSAFPSRLRRLPDGEPATRWSFTGWQRDVFSHSPVVLEQYKDDGDTVVPQQRASPAEVAEVVKNMPPLKPKYDDFALESYAEFKRLRAEGTIPQGVRFLVCLPTVYCVMSLLRAEFAAAIEPLYTEALLGCLKRIEAEIPHEDLAVQVDVAAETMLIQTPPGEVIFHFDKYWNDDAFEGSVERIAALVGSVAPGVEVGMHICYGDMKHKHFIQPKDTEDIVRITNSVAQKAGRPINWVHFPVPRDRDDDAYFQPLEGLKTGSDTEFFIGLVHPHDEDGSRKRLEVAARHLKGKRYGVATECGLGRAPQDEFDTIAKISTAISGPII
ncbi:hypothetical protein PFICI_02469 [Pestalotiopsis fici W106-1]|uniref:Cobalamin-independent methionine synthase MetE C-terminal/archaeal domain-containing protein n=1 Tax=Pestalotiopsis fici (strain W106-1 / CGMCC3.15140) TaxID=1229662 RepID=W3XEK0_PESFW|nr:uncharacterized protein PFICI_02469 [Pestalotiopsis fici W106-1]ETS84444.1 hypothetical protein PFICI_02469 [Pestalotiopsis fici W106-1]